MAETHFTHPAVVGAAVSLMAKAGATRIRVLESGWATADPVEEFLLQASLEPRDILGAAPNVEFENTNYLGKGKKYSRLMVPTGGYIFPGFDLNHSYAECDVFVSIAKMKEHATAGYTGAMKNCFGNAPATIYGDGAGVDEPSRHAAWRPGDCFHYGKRQPSKSAPQEKDTEYAPAGNLPGAADCGGPGGRQTDPPGHRRRHQVHDCAAKGRGYPGPHRAARA